MARATKRMVMNAHGKYLKYADHLAKIKAGEETGDTADFARACQYLDGRRVALEASFFGDDDKEQDGDQEMED
jgi:hypothetical protein